MTKLASSPRCALLMMALLTTLHGASPAAAEAPRTAKVVLAVPLDGPYAALGEAMQRAAQEAIDRLNATGHIAGHALSLAVVDDSCSGEGGAKAAEDALRHAPVAVVGHPCGSAAIAAAPRYAAARALLLAAGPRHSALTAMHAGPLVFRIAGRDDALGGEAGARLLQLAQPGASLAIVHDRTQVSRGVAAEAARAVHALAPATRIDVLTIVAGETDYTRTAAAIAGTAPYRAHSAGRSAGQAVELPALTSGATSTGAPSAETRSPAHEVGAVLFAGFPAEGAILLRQLRAAGGDMAFLVTDTHASPEFAADAGALLDERVEAMLPVAAAIDGASAPGRPVANAAARAASEVRSAIELLARAARRTGSFTATAIAHQLRHGSAAGLGLAFDARGDAIAPSFAPFRYRDGRWLRVR